MDNPVLNGTNHSGPRFSAYTRLFSKTYLPVFQSRQSPWAYGHNYGPSNRTRLQSPRTVVLNARDDANGLFNISTILHYAQFRPKPSQSYIHRGDTIARRVNIVIIIISVSDRFRELKFGIRPEIDYILYYCNIGRRATRSVCVCVCVLISRTDWRRDARTHAAAAGPYRGNTSTRPACRARARVLFAQKL